MHRKCYTVTEMTLREYIENYAPRYRGHTPGHKGSVDSRDITEILDVFPSDLVERAERRAAALYGARAVRFLVGGSSAGLKAAVLACAKRGIVTDSYAHVAVEGGAALAKLPLYKLGESIGADGLPTLTDAESVAKAMDETRADCAVVQYPDYYGRVPELAAIYEVVKDRGGTLICDSAHGAHFALRPDLFPQSAHLYSDLCNMSAHKTLGSMTQTAFLVFGRGGDEKIVGRALEALGTTSPNYILLASLEKCVDDAKRIKPLYDGLRVFSERMRNKFPHLENADFTRLALDFGDKGRQAAYAYLDKGIAAEKYDERYAVFILTPYDGADGLDAFAAATEEVYRELRVK